MVACIINERIFENLFQPIISLHCGPFSPEFDRINSLICENCEPFISVASVQKCNAPYVAAYSCRFILIISFAVASPHEVLMSSGSDFSADEN